MQDALCESFWRSQKFTFLSTTLSLLGWMPVSYLLVVSVVAQTVALSLLLTCLSFLNFIMCPCFLVQDARVKFAEGVSKFTSFSIYSISFGLDACFLPASCFCGSTDSGNLSSPYLSFISQFHYVSVDVDCSVV